MLHRDPPPVRVLTNVLVAGGGLAVLATLVQEAVGLGQEGLGATQTAVMAIGAALAALGVLASADKRRAVAGFWTAGPRPGFGTCLLLAALFGLGLGYVELGHQLVRKYGFGVLLKQPVHIVWMIPLSYLLMSAVLGLIAAVLLRIRALPFAAVAFVFAALAVWSQLRIHRVLGDVAPWLLAAGVAVQAARSAPQRFDRLVRAARWAVPALLLLVGATAAGVPAARAWAEHRALAALPEPRPGAPNVLLLVLDTVRADHLADYGYHRATAPIATRELIARGVLFERSIAPSSWTLPTHASLFTGRYGSEHGATWKVPLDGTYPTLAEALSAHGWATAGFAGNLVYCAEEYGIARGFAHYEDFYVELPVLAWSSSAGEWIAFRTFGRQFTQWVRNDAARVTDAFLGWLDGLEDERPFFAFVNYFDAHSLVVPPEPHLSTFAPPGDILLDWYWTEKWTDEEYQVFRNAYDGAIHYIDAQVGRILDRLRATGRLENTLVVLTADHGEQFGEHGLKDHGNSLYYNSVHVPLVLSWPGRIPENARVAPFVSLCDVPATILDLAGVAPAVAPFPGTSLVPLFDGEANGGAAALSPPISELDESIQMPRHWKNYGGDMVAVILDERMRYIRNGDGSEELYDIEHDVLELHDLSKAPEHQQVMARARERAARGAR